MSLGATLQVRQGCIFLSSCTLFLCAILYQSIPGESPNTILTNTCVAGSNGEQTSQLMFCVSWGLMKRFSGGFLISISLPATDLECLIKSLIFNSTQIEINSVKQCPPLLVIPMIWNHLVR